jgi:hypothetical protein
MMLKGLEVLANYYKQNNINLTPDDYVLEKLESSMLNNQIDKFLLVKGKNEIQKFYHEKYESNKE